MTRYVRSAAVMLVLGGCASGSQDGCGCSDANLPLGPGGTAATLRLDAPLSGQYAAGLTLVPVSVDNIGPGQEVVVTLRARGLQGVGQFDFILQPEPATTFDMAGSSFVPKAPFITFQNGVEQQTDGRVRLVGVDLQRSSNGDAELGTLHLKTAASFSGSSVALRAVFFSIGPKSTERNNYDADALRLGITINPGRARPAGKG